MNVFRNLIVACCAVAFFAVVLSDNQVAQADTQSIVDITPSPSPSSSATATPTPTPTATVVAIATETATATPTADVSDLPTTGASSTIIILLAGVLFVSTVAFFSLPSKRS